jgi:uncharacterized membrane protein
MDDDHEQIFVAAYGDLDRARTDFHELDKRVKAGLELRAAVLVTKDADGHPQVVEASNRHGRVAAGVGASLGFLLGIFIPPVGLGVLVGGAAGALVASFAEHELRIGLRHEIGEALEAGTGVVIAAVYPNGRAPVEMTLYRAAKTTVVRMDKSTVNTLEDAVAKAMTEIGHPISTGTTDTST